jgi:glycerophosphoryl diester phosphodiesterase
MTTRSLLWTLALAAAPACAPPETAPPGEGPARLAPFLDACLFDAACDEVLVVAHRGEGVAEPENSRAAVRAVAAAGADVVELDVRPTRDGVPIVLHDDTFTRTTDQAERFPGRPAASDLDLAEVKTLTLRDDEGRCGDPDADEERCRVPTFREALQVARGRALVMIDYKGGDIARVVDDILAEEADGFAWFFDSNEANLDLVEALAPGVATMARADDTASALDLLSRRTPRLLHVDTGYVAELQEAAAVHGTRLLVNIFGQVDFGIIGEELTGDTRARADAELALTEIVDDGADLVQTNRAPVVRSLLDRP